jgi:hypothetical protein
MDDSPAPLAIILRWGWAMGVGQLGLDLTATVLASAGRSDGQTIRSTLGRRGAVGTAFGTASRSVLLAVKRLQGHTADDPFQYVSMGQSWVGYAVPFVSWVYALRFTTDRRTAAAVALGLTTVLRLSRFYPLVLVYTGGGGLLTTHGGGINIYYTGDTRSRYFDGERFFALDWHAEKLSERGEDGRFAPRAQQRSVVWPHAHMCWLGLEFWPWSKEIGQSERHEIQEQRRQAREVRANRRLAREEPSTVDHDALAAAVAAALSRAGCRVELELRFTAGGTVRDVGAWLAGQIVTELTAARLAHRAEVGWTADATAVQIDVDRAALRAAGRQFAAWKAEKRRN